MEANDVLASELEPARDVEATFPGTLIIPLLKLLFVGFLTKVLDFGVGTNIG